ncbi:MAG: EAL domain-containing protein [Rubrivivax sp.]|nr:EAL domain-containing protein [Rubrivivax sp.]
MRVAMYLAFVAVALVVGLHARNTLRLDEVRAAETEILEQASLQRRFSQQVAREATLLLVEPQAREQHFESIAQLMERWGKDTLVIEGLLARQFERSPDAARSVGPALQAWQAARERLWYRSELLLQSNDADGDEAALRRRTMALLAEVEPALAAAVQLSAKIRAASDSRAQGVRDDLRVGLFSLLALLGVLALVVVEPTANSVRRHAQRLAEQATELQRLAMVAEHTSALVLITDADDRVVWANPAFCGVAGWPLAEATGRRPGELFHSPHADEAVLARARQAVREGRGVRLEWLHRARDGRDLWLDVDLCPLRDERGELSGFIRVCSDVTARVRQQAKLQALWAALPAGVMVQAADGSVVDANRAAERLLGLSLAEMQDRDLGGEAVCALHEDGSEIPGHEHPVMRTLAGGEALQNQTMGVRTPGGQLRWLQCNTEPLRDTAGQVTGVVTCFSDITERRALQDRLSESARTDALTRLPNRAVVMERLERAVEHARRHPGYGFAVLFMDFDRFKQVNDSLGHSAGDELLRQIAQRLQRTLRPGDAVARLGSMNQVAARLGGDEFVIVLEGLHDAHAVGVVATRLLLELAEPYLIGCTPVQSSASIGIVLCTDAVCAGEDPAEKLAEEMLRNADTAMYEAKRAGRGRWVMFDGSMHERLVRALDVENDLRRALKDDELFVVYQPVMDLGSRAMVAVEALVRWRHPVRGLVGPAEFVGVAEECGLIDAVGATVLRQACAQFMRWQHTPGLAAPRQLAVNLSSAQIGRAALVEEVRAVLQEFGMQPEQLQLEVTESLAAQDERVQHTLRELKSLGVRLALDDFGTGYSSLACLHQLPVDTVKIDRSFIEHAETVEYHRVLIEATIRVARTLGMTTVAEGIETEGQAELMRALDCDRGQGYLFSQPLEAQAVEGWARAQFEAEHVDTV